MAGHAIRADWGPGGEQYCSACGKGLLDEEHDLADAISCIANGWCLGWRDPRVLDEAAARARLEAARVAEEVTVVP